MSMSLIRGHDDKENMSLLSILLGASCLDG